MAVWMTPAYRRGESCPFWGRCRPCPRAQGRGWRAGGELAHAIVTVAKRGEAALAAVQSHACGGMLMLVFACIAPHGGETVEALGAPARDQAHATRWALRTLHDRARAAGVDTWVVVEPHGVRVDGAMAVSVTERASGTVEAAGPGGRSLSVAFPVDQDLANRIEAAARGRGVPVARVGYGGSAGPASCYPLDWGAIIPLWHLAGASTDVPRIVVVTPSRVLTWEDMVRFGEALFDAIEGSAARVGLVASADLAHAHLASGPYGYDEAAAVFDRAVRDAVEAGDLLRLLAIDPAIVAAARPDGQWQILVLAGVLARARMRPVFLSYEVPTYFGMLCAACEPLDETAAASAS